MQTLSYGYLKPQTGDKGSIFFPALEADIQQLNDHNHNGINSAKLTAASVTAITQSVPAVSWVSQGGGTYRQLVTLPGGLQYDDYFIGFKLSTLGHIIYPTIEKVSATTYYVYTNDNSLDYTAVYFS